MLFKGNQVMTPQATFCRRGEQLQYDRMRWECFGIPAFHLFCDNILATDKWLHKSFLQPPPTKERIIGKSITRSKHLIIQSIIRQWDRKWGWEAEKPAAVRKNNTRETWTPFYMMMDENRSLKHADWAVNTWPKPFFTNSLWLISLVHELEHKRDK